MREINTGSDSSFFVRDWSRAAGLSSETVTKRDERPCFFSLIHSSRVHIPRNALSCPNKKNEADKRVAPGE